jgi:hypothetical protein
MKTYPMTYLISRCQVRVNHYVIAVKMILMVDARGAHSTAPAGSGARSGASSHRHRPVGRVAQMGCCRPSQGRMRNGTSSEA